VDRQHARIGGAASARGDAPVTFAAGDHEALLPPGHQLLASCFDAEDTSGGGLFAYDGRSVRVVDRLSTTGLDLADGRLLRCLWSDLGSPAELLVYDEHGLLRYQRVDGVANPHDARWLGEDALVVATAQNRVVWLSPAGLVTRVWQPPGEPDSWHLNSLVEHRGDLLVCAFGRFQRWRGWDDAGRPASGCLVDVASGEEVLGGLRAPHSPQFADGAWLLCDSDAGELVRVDGAARRVTRRVRLGGWPRGLALSDHALFVGVSPARRRAPASATARVEVLDRSSWRRLGTVDLPGREVYDLLLVPDRLVAAAERASGTNATRRREQAQRRLFEELGVQPSRVWALGDPLLASERRATVRAVSPVPAVAPPGSLLELRCAVANRGAAILTTAPPNPVHLVHEWLAAGGPGPTDGTPGARLDGTPRARLPRSLPPGEEVEVPLLLRVPPEPGRYRLRLTLEQAGVGRFDELDHGSAADYEVRAGAGGPAARGRGRDGFRATAVQKRSGEKTT